MSTTSIPPSPHQESDDLAKRMFTFVIAGVIAFVGVALLVVSIGR